MLMHQLNMAVVPGRNTLYRRKNKRYTFHTTRVSDMSVLKRGRGGKNVSVTSHDNTNSRGTCSTPQSRPVISPLSLQQQLEEMPINSPPTPHTQNSSAGSSTAINKCRGVYKSINVNLRTAQGVKIRVKFSDSMSRAIGPEARACAIRAKTNGAKDTSSIRYLDAEGTTTCGYLF